MKKQRWDPMFEQFCRQMEELYYKKNFQIDWEKQQITYWNNDSLVKKTITFCENVSIEMSRGMESERFIYQENTYSVYMGYIAYKMVINHNEKPFIFDIQRGESFNSNFLISFTRISGRSISNVHCPKLISSYKKELFKFVELFLKNEKLALKHLTGSVRFYSIAGQVTEFAEALNDCSNYDYKNKEKIL